MNFQCIRDYYFNKFINIIIVSAFLIFIIFVIFTAGICSGFQGLPVSTIPASRMLNNEIATENDIQKSTKTVQASSMLNDKLNIKEDKKQSKFSEKLTSVGKTMLASTTALSTKKIGWGIQRKDNHEQPDLGAENKRIIEEFNGMAMGNKDSKNIYLTFDVGYENGYTNQILDILKENDVPAAFFITGQLVKTNPEIVERMINEGHIVGNHF